MQHHRGAPRDHQQEEKRQLCQAARCGECCGVTDQANARSVQQDDQRDEEEGGDGKERGAALAAHELAEPRDQCGGVGGAEWPTKE